LETDQLYIRVADAVWSVVAGANLAAFERSDELAQGSAVAAAPDRLLTNCHLFDGRRMVVIVQGDSADRAWLIAADPETDRCVLKPDAIALRPVGGVRAYADLRVGEKVFTVGSPLGLERSLGEGLISGLRTVQNLSLVQTTAPISSGSSGGGLFDSRGNLIGITTFLFENSQQLNFAIAADEFWQKD
jgi:S1-C subfamily serine protease